MAEANAKPEAAKSGDNSMIVVNIGKKYKKKHIRRLRKGRGRLMEKVEQLVEDLRESGGVSDDVQPVVIVVRRKSSRFRF